MFNQFCLFVFNLRSLPHGRLRDIGSCSIGRWRKIPTLPRGDGIGLEIKEHLTVFIAIVTLKEFVLEDDQLCAEKYCQVSCTITFDGRDFVSARPLILGWHHFSFLFFYLINDFFFLKFFCLVVLLSVSLYSIRSFCIFHPPIDPHRSHAGGILSPIDPIAMKWFHL